MLKQIDTATMGRDERKDAEREAELHKTLINPYIVKYEDSFKESFKLNILLEYMENQDLGVHIKKQAGRPLKEDKIWKYFIQALLGLQYLHARKILHRDIKTINLFMGKADTIKIGDLGVAKQQQDRA